MKPVCLSAATAAMSLLAGPDILAARNDATSSDPPATSYVEIGDDTLLVGPFNVSVDELDEFDVIDASGEKIGEIGDVLADSSGAPVAVVLETEGQTGPDNDGIVVSLDRLDLLGADLQIDMTREELDSSPRWDD